MSRGRRGAPRSLAEARRLLASVEQKLRADERERLAREWEAARQAPEWEARE